MSENPTHNSGQRPDPDLSWTLIIKGKPQVFRAYSAKYEKILGQQRHHATQGKEARRVDLREASTVFANAVRIQRRAHLENHGGKSVPHYKTIGYTDRATTGKEECVAVGFYKMENGDIVVSTALKATTRQQNLLRQVVERARERQMSRPTKEIDRKQWDTWRESHKEGSSLSRRQREEKQEREHEKNRQRKESRAAKRKARHDEIMRLKAEGGDEAVRKAEMARKNALKKEKEKGRDSRA